MTPKPSYDVLMKLIKGKWWTGPLTLKTDRQGRVTIRGFLGDYEVQAGGHKAAFRLDAAGTSRRGHARRCQHLVTACLRGDTSCKINGRAE